MSRKKNWLIFSPIICFLFMTSAAEAKNLECPKCEETRCLLPPEESCAHCSMTLGFLLEQARITGSQYAYSKYGNAIGSIGLPAIGAVFKPSFKLNWGITAGLAYDFPNKHWTLTSRFDWLRSKGKANNPAPADSNIIPINIWRDQFFSAINADLGAAGYANSKFSVTYYNFNVDLNRPMYIDCNFTLVPHAGLKLSFIYDKVSSLFTGNGADASFSPLTYLNTNILVRRQKTNFWGIGPSLGVNTEWDFFFGLSVFMEGSAAILVGNSKTSDSVSNSVYANSKTYSSSPNIPVFSPTIQTLLGLKYERNICNDTQGIIAKLGWDTAIFWNQWNHINVISESTFNSSLDTFQLKEGDTFGLTGLLFNLTWNF